MGLEALAIGALTGGEVLGLAGAAASIGGMFQGSKKAKVRMPQPKSVGQLHNEALGETKSSIAHQKEFGQQFIDAQFASQRAALPDFFKATEAGFQGAFDLGNRIFAGSPEQRMGVNAQRASQAARGIALSPSAALAEGLQQAQAQINFERQGLSAFNQASQFAKASPFGVKGLEMASIGQLLGVGQAQDQQRVGLESSAAMLNAEQQMAANSAQGAMMSQFGAGLSGAGAAGGMGIGGYGAMQGFMSAYGGQSAAGYQNQNLSNAMQNYFQGQSNVGQLGAPAPGAAVAAPTYIPQGAPGAQSFNIG